MIIGVDFDGTIVEHSYPSIGNPVPYAIETLTCWCDMHHKLILTTMRSGSTLNDAVRYLHTSGITLWGINRNPEQHTWTDSPKVYCEVLIDDSALGCPLIYPDDNTRPYVDWLRVQRFIRELGLITPLKADL